MSYAMHNNYKSRNYLWLKKKNLLLFFRFIIHIVFNTFTLKLSIFIFI